MWGLLQRDEGGVALTIPLPVRSLQWNDEGGWTGGTRYSIRQQVVNLLYVADLDVEVLSKEGSVKDTLVFVFLSL